MTEKVTKKIYGRITHEGLLNVVSCDEIEAGTSVADAWDGEEPYRDFAIEVAVTPPKTIEESIAASVEIPDPPAPDPVTATAA
jgi:hypothetical protein